MVKSGRRKRMDPEKAEAKRAEWAQMARIRNKDERRERRKRQAEPISRIMDSGTPPAEAAELILQEFPNKPAVGAAIIKIVQQIAGEPIDRLYEAARLALTEAPGKPPPGPGILAFAAAAAHAVGDEEAVRRYTDEVHRRADEVAETHAADAKGVQKDKQQWLNAIKVTEGLGHSG